MREGLRLKELGDERRFLKYLDALLDYATSGGRGSDLRREVGLERAFPTVLFFEYKTLIFMLNEKRTGSSWGGLRSMH